MVRHFDRLNDHTLTNQRIFGIKEVMIKFLNSVLDVEGGIVDLQYGNPEKLGFTQFDRKAVYDPVGERSRTMYYRE